MDELFGHQLYSVHVLLIDFQGSENVFKFTKKVKNIKKTRRSRVFLIFWLLSECKDVKITRKGKC